MSTSKQYIIEKKKSIDKGVLLLSALFFPFFSMVYSYLNKNNGWLKNIFWIGCAYSGLVFIYDPLGGTLNDYTRYAEMFQDFSNYPISLKEIILNSFTTGIYKDFFLPFLIYLISFISKDPRIFFFCFSIIFGFFYSRNIWYIFDKIPFKYNVWISILILFYILCVPFWGLVRIWLAIHIFTYGALPFIYNKDKSKIIWVFIAFFVHFAMIFPIIIFVLYYFLPKKSNIYIIFFIITIFIKEIDLAFIRDLLLKIFPFMSVSIESYVNETYLEYRESIEYTWHVGLADIISNITLSILVLFTYFNIRDNHKGNYELNRLFYFSLLLYGASNIFALVPSGGRFIYLSQLFMLPAIIFSFIYLNEQNKYQRLLKLNLLLLFPILFKIRLGLGFYGISFFTGNFFTALFVDSNIPLINYLK